MGICSPRAHLSVGMSSGIVMGHTSMLMALRGVLVHHTAVVIGRAAEQHGLGGVPLNG